MTEQTSDEWIVLVINGDTLVQGPYDDLLMFAANRKVADYITRNYAFRMNSKTKVIRSLESELELTRVSRDVAVADSRACFDEIGRLEASLDACNEKRAGQKVWSSIGKVALVVATAGTVVLVKQSLDD